MDSFSDFFEENDAETIRKIQQEYFERPDEEIDDTFLADDIDENNSPEFQVDDVDEMNEDRASAEETILIFDRDDDIDTSNAEDAANVKKFFQQGCGCIHRCTTHFEENDIVNLRAESNCLNFWENHINNQDIAILGQLATFISTGAETTRSKQIQTDRKLTRSNFQLKSIRVCSAMYLFAMNISRKKFRRLKDIYLQNGMTPNVHGKHKKTPRHAINTEVVQNIVTFLKRYAEQHAIYLPGRYPNQKNFSVKLLPSVDNRSVMYGKYEENCKLVNKIPVSRSTFTRTWSSFCPDITTMKPKNDLCETCQKNYTSHSKITSTFETDAAKLQLINSMKSHLDNVTNERKVFDDMIKSTRKLYEDQKDAVEYAHYSFDMAQTVSLPSNPLQPGPLYFLAPFKVAIFGVMNDTAKIQHNFLIPEDRDAGKGVNAILSMLHYYFENYSMKERHLYLHADNCRGQNKNNYMMWYLLWRVITQRHASISLSFLPVGHTKFHCDWAFGLVKQKYKVTAVSSMDELCDVVTQSTPKSKLNKAVDVSKENIPFYNWHQFFDELQFKYIPALSKQSSFIFEQSRPEEIGTKLHSLDEEVVYHKIYNFCDEASRFPELIPPESFGLSHDRQVYLYKNIREYCSEHAKDILCPKPPEKVVEIRPKEDPKEKKRKNESKKETNPKKPRGRPKKVEGK